MIDYETRNELLIYWTSGVSKINFANKVIFLSLILTIFQIGIGGFFSPFSQYKGREILKDSDIDFFTSLIKEGKFINAVDGLTIFIKEKNDDETFKHVFIDDSSKGISRMIYAKNGNIIENNKKKIFKLYEGKIINQERKINAFEFDEIDFNLVIIPRIQSSWQKSRNTFCDIVKMQV